MTKNVRSREAFEPQAAARLATAAPERTGLRVTLTLGAVTSETVALIRRAYETNGKPWVEGAEQAFATLLEANRGAECVVPYDIDKVLEAADKAEPALKREIAERFKTGRTDQRRAAVRQESAKAKTALARAPGQQAMAPPVNAPKRPAITALKLRELEATFALAGLPKHTAETFARDGLNHGAARAALDLLMQEPPTREGFGARLVAVALLSHVAASPGRVSVGTLVQAVERFSGIMTLRPDGYLVSLPNGKPIQKAGTVTDDLKVGELSVGEIYALNAGVLHSIDEAGRPAGAVGELHLEHVALDRVLDGAFAALKSQARAIVELVRDPARAVEGIPRIPGAIADLIRSSPEYASQFLEMPFGDQVEAASNLATNLALLAAGGAGASRAVTSLSSLAKVTVPVVALSAEGALVVEMMSVEALAGARLLAGGPGAFGGLYILSKRLPDPAAVNESRAKAVEHYGARDGQYGQRETPKGRVELNPGAERWKLGNRASGENAVKADLLEHEGQGHTLAQHVEKSRRQLANRLRAQPKKRVVSTFESKVEAQEVVDRVLAANREKIDIWAAQSPNWSLELTERVSCGLVLKRGATDLVRGNGVRVVLFGNGAGGWGVHTSYPMLLSR